jgi:hypothetical protein
MAILLCFADLMFAGQIVGGAWGAIEGNKHREATTTRLRINTILNGITKRGPLMGNSLAVVGLRLLLNHSLAEILQL